MSRTLGFGLVLGPTVVWGNTVGRPEVRPGNNERRERGAALVEFAILLPLFVTLIFGMVTIGIAFERQLGVTHAARESGRHGATLPVSNFAGSASPIDAWLDAVATRSVADAGGSLDPGTPGLFICVAFVHPDGTTAADSTRRRVEDPLGALYADEACFSDGRPDAERRVQVQVGRDSDLNAVLFNWTVALRSEAVARYEAALIGS